MDAVSFIYDAILVNYLKFSFFPPVPFSILQLEAFLKDLVILAFLPIFMLKHQ